MKKRIVLIGLVVAAGIFLWRWNHDSVFRYAGTIEATRVDISPQVSSLIEGIDVHEGDTVSAAQVLVRLNCEDLKLNADIAERDYQRALRLHEDGAIPEEAFDRARYKRDDAALKAGWCVIRSPLAATVLDRYREPGEMVNPSMKLLTLADLREVWADVYAPQPMLAGLSLAHPVAALIPEIKRTIHGRITRIADEAEFTPKNVQTREERTRLVYAIRITFPNPDGLLKPGMTIEATLP